MGKVFRQLTGWGLFPKANCYVQRPERARDLPEGRDPRICRGLGRSYSDAALNRDRDVILTERLFHLLHFDDKTGIVKAEAGATLADLLNVFVPRGLYLPTCPGTKYVTLGGAFAADVHGKNHHVNGTLGAHVKEIKLLLASGEALICSPSQNSELFFATQGGMGLTGTIMEVSLGMQRVETGYMKVEHKEAQNLLSVLSLLEQYQKASYSVAWLDGTPQGKGVVMHAEHAKKEDLSHGSNPLHIHLRKLRPIPSFLSILLNDTTISWFNEFYYRAQIRKKRPFLLDYDQYFFPLDALKNWPYLYGKQGFLQYQCVVPSKEAIIEIFAEMKKRNFRSYLTVLKKMGKQNPAHLSFPMEGLTLAMDFPIKDSGLFAMLDVFDEIVLADCGRIYLAKDARVKPEIFQKMYGRFHEWMKIKKRIDPGNVYQSDLSRRLEITP